MHAQERALQRYNKELTDKDLENIGNEIMGNRHTYLYDSKDSKSKKFCFVKYNHIPYKVLYTIKKKKCKIITIYPFNVDEYNEIQEQKEQERIERCINFLKTKGYIVYKRK